MSVLPAGKGAFIWQPDLVEGGDPDKLVAAVGSAGFGHVVFKVANDTHAYPYDAAKRAMLVAMVRALKLAGVQVWGYGYVYLVDPAGEAAIAIRQVNELELTGYYIDAEGEAKGPGKDVAANTFMTRLRSAYPDLPIGLCSYRYPSYHPELPWEAFRRLCSFDAPQVYWVGAHDPVTQLNKSYGEFQAMTPRLPYAPVGSAYQAGTWSPTAGDWVAFLDCCRVLGFSGANFWEWAKTKTYLPNLFDAIAGYSWPLPEPPAPPEPEPDAVLDAVLTLRDRVEDVFREMSMSFTSVHEAIAGAEQRILAAIGSAPTPTPTPEPEPANTVGFRITEDPRCNARFYEVWNEIKKALVPKVDGADKPIWMTYPADDSDADDRAQFTKETVVTVALPAETGTGGIRCLQLVSGVDRNGKTWTEGAHGEKLYIPQASGTKLV